MKRNNKKKLPGYWLGTRKPTTLGYLPSRGIGDSLTATNPGISIRSDVLAMRQNFVPSMIGKAGSSFQFPMQMAQTFTKAAPVNAGGAAASTSGEMALQGATNATKSLSTAGTVLGALGTAYGLYNVGTDIANAGDHRTAGNMRSTLTTNTYTTAGGNTYTEKTGLDTSGELEYENQNRRAKQMGLTLDSIGLGASAGGLVGGTALAGSIGGPLGMGIGAGIGLLAGGLASLFGFGDNEDEVREQMQILGDETARVNRQSRSEALDQDVKSAFYSGEASAEYGKSPYGKMDGDKKHGIKTEILQGPEGYSFGKAHSMIAPNEGLYNTLTMDGSVAKGKEAGDTIPSSISPGDPTVVFSDKLGFAKIANPIIEEQNRLKNIIINASGSSKQKLFQTMMAEKAMKNNHQKLLALSEEQNIVRDNMKTGKYKNGKLPGFSFGSKLADYSSAMLPNFFGFVTNLALKNRDKYADSYVPEMTISNPEAVKAYEQTMSDMISPTLYLNMSQRNYNLAAWNARRAVNAGYGGRMTMLNSLYRAKQALDAETLMKINESNRAQRNIGAGMLDKYGTDKLAKQYDQFWRRFGHMQQQNAARDYALRTDDYNMYKMLAAAADAYDSVNKYRQAYDIQNKQIGIWQLSANTDTMKAVAEINKMFNPTSTINTSSTIDPSSESKTSWLKRRYNFFFPEL